MFEIDENKKASCQVVKKLIDLNPEENRFNLIALAAKEAQ